MLKYGQKPEMRWIGIDLFKINSKYQRETDTKRSKANIDKIRRTFCWADFTPLTVAGDEDGFYSIIDGQHRFEAARSLGDITELPCWIVKGADLRSQAKNFMEINTNRVAVNPYTVFKAQIAAGDELALKTDDFCRRVGIVIPFSGYCSAPSMSLALTAIKAQLKKHNDVYLEKAVKLIRRAFPDVCGQIKADILNTLVDLFVEQGDRLGTERLLATLRAFETVDKITAKARELRVLDKTLSFAEAHKKVFVSKLKEIRKEK